MVLNAGELLGWNVLFVRNNILAHRGWNFLQFMENHEIEVFALAGIFALPELYKTYFGHAWPGYEQEAGPTN